MHKAIVVMVTEKKVTKLLLEYAKILHAAAVVNQIQYLGFYSTMPLIQASRKSCIKRKATEQT